MYPNPTDFFSEEDYQAALDEAAAGPATPSDACREYARNAGAMFPERAWILTDFDTWERNPSYAGPWAPHPESYDVDPETGEMIWPTEPKARPRPDPEPDLSLGDDIPF